MYIKGLKDWAYINGFFDDSFKSNEIDLNLIFRVYILKFN